MSSSPTSYPLPRGLSQLDLGGVLKNSHEIQAEALRVIDVDNLVNAYFTRADVTYNVDGSATSASFYYDKNNQVELITVLDDVGGSLNNKYFLLDGPRGINKYYTWYDVDSLGTDPAIPGRVGIQVPISAGDSDDIVALATRLALSLNSNIQKEFTVQNLDNKVKLVAKITGVTLFVDGNSLFEFEAKSVGVTEFVKDITLPYENGVRYVYNEYEKTFEIFPTLVISVDVSSATTPGIINQTLALANTEYAIAIPLNTEQFTIRLREDNASFRIYTSSGSSTYFTVRRCCNYTVKDLDLATTTIYIQSDKANSTVEMLYWGQ